MSGIEALDALQEALEGLQVNSYGQEASSLLEGIIQAVSAASTRLSDREMADYYHNM